MKNNLNLKSINKVELLSFPSFSDHNGVLTVLDNIDLIPFKVARFFTVSAEKKLYGDNMRIKNALNY